MYKPTRILPILLFEQLISLRNEQFMKVSVNLCFLLRLKATILVYLPMDRLAVESLIGK